MASSWPPDSGMRPGEDGGMTLPSDPGYRHRFPPVIIRHAAWLYHVFSLSPRETLVQEITHNSKCARSVCSESQPCTADSTESLIVLIREYPFSGIRIF